MSQYFRQVILVLLCLVTSAAVPKESTFFIVTMGAPGSPSDRAARYYAPALQVFLGQPVVVRNVTGGQGLLAMRQYKDLGETCDSVLLGNANLLHTALAKEPLDFNPLVQFVPVHGVTNAPGLLAPGDRVQKNAEDWSAIFVNEGVTGKCRKRLENVMRLTLESALGERYAQQSGGDVRFLASSQQVREFMRYQYKVLSETKSR